ncbi:hypothetical protein ACFLZ9_02110, partial [Patescibacteria group bacterium]
KPDTKFDEKFASELKKEILSRAQELKDSKTSESKPMLPFTFFNKFSYAIGGALITLVLFVPIFTYFTREGSQILPSTKDKLAVNLNQGIEKVKNQAFGSLANQDASFSTERSEAGRGGGGGLMAPSAATPQAISADEAAVSSKMIAPAPRMVEFNYTYAGDEITLNQSTVDVYKRVISDSTGKSLAQSISGLDLDLIDLSKFKDRKVNNLSMVEDREFGYYISFNMDEDFISINSNWNKWPQVAQKCWSLPPGQSESCYQSTRLKMSDVPSDDKLISIAKSFIKEYGIDISNYGEPIIMDYWKREFEISRDKSNVYVPENIPVMFPLIIEGQTAYEQSGEKTGLMVDINIRYNLVNGAHTIMPYNYISSSYEAVTDVEKILELAENGGLYPQYFYNESGDAIEIELGTPTMGLMRHYVYDQETRKSDQLYVPSLIFPITNISDKSARIFQKNIIIPLAQEIIDSFDRPDHFPPMPRPMPLMDGPEPIMLEEAEAVQVDDNE